MNPPTTWVIGTEPRSYARATNAQPLTISLALLSSHNLYTYLYDYITVYPNILDVRLEGKEANAHLMAEVQISIFVLKMM